MNKIAIYEWVSLFEAWIVTGSCVVNHVEVGSNLPAVLRLIFFPTFP